MRPSPKERAAAFIRKGARPSIAGQQGDNTTHAVACSLVVDFALSDGDAMELLCEYNRTKCSPPWSDRDLERHLRSARRTANGKPGDVGKALDQDAKDYTGPRLPANNGAPRAEAKAPAPAPQGGKPPPGSGRRTQRTAFFEVHPFGEGAKARTPRAVRTLHSYSIPISSVQSSPLSRESKKEVSEKSAPKPEAAKPAVVPAPKPVPAKVAVPQQSRLPIERVDVTTIWNDTGEVNRNGKVLGNIKGARNG